MLRRRKEIVQRKIHDTYFLIDITEKYTDNKCHLYEINEIGSFIWSQLEYVNKIDSLVKMIMEMVDDSVGYQEISKDIAEFINVLLEEGFLEEVN